MHTVCGAQILSSESELLANANCCLPQLLLFCCMQSYAVLGSTGNAIYPCTQLFVNHLYEPHMDYAVFALANFCLFKRCSSANQQDSKIWHNYV